MKSIIYGVQVAILVVMNSVAWASTEPKTFSNDTLELNVNVLWGGRIFGSWDDSEFSLNLDDMRYQRVTGLEVDFGKKRWPVNIWLGYTQSSVELSISGYEFNSNHSEYFIGARAYFLGFYISGAAANIGGDYTGKRIGETREVIVGNETGLLCSAGIDWTFLMLNMGLDARALVGTANNDYILFGVKMGFHLE